jgi:hypothetical protein
VHALPVRRMGLTHLSSYLPLCGIGGIFSAAPAVRLDAFGSAQDRLSAECLFRVRKFRLGHLQLKLSDRCGELWQSDRSWASIYPVPRQMKQPGIKVSAELVPHAGIVVETLRNWNIRVIRIIERPPRG